MQQFGKFLDMLMPLIAAAAGIYMYRNKSFPFFHKKPWVIVAACILVLLSLQVASTFTESTTSELTIDGVRSKVIHSSIFVTTDSTINTNLGFSILIPKQSRFTDLSDNNGLMIQNDSDTLTITIERLTTFEDDRTVLNTLHNNLLRFDSTYHFSEELISSPFHETPFSVTKNNILLHGKHWVLRNNNVVLIAAAGAPQSKWVQLEMICQKVILSITFL
ncbi:hypothetical protein L6Q79_16160 [bacterium]|nr:hypothetical protein [bacterium]